MLSLYWNVKIQALLDSIALKQNILYNNTYPKYKTGAA